MRTAKRIAIAVVRDADRFLAGPRPAGAALAGYWEFPGGKVEAGESAEEAAVRECREEAGLDVVAGDELDFRDHDYAHDRVHLRFFDCRCVDSTQTPRPPFRWVPRGELASLRFPDANLPIVARLTEGTAGEAARREDG